MLALLSLRCRAQVYFEELPPGEERTLEYKFQLAPQVQQQQRQASRQAGLRAKQSGALRV